MLANLESPAWLAPTGNISFKGENASHVSHLASCAIKMV